MRWALRILALAQLASVAVFGAIASMTSPHTLPHRTEVALYMFLALASQTGFYLGVIVCVIAIVASLQQGQRRWAITLMVLLVLALYALSAILDVLPNIPFTTSWLLPLLALSEEGYRFATELVPGLVLALAVLIFSFWRLRPAASRSTGDAGVGGIGGMAGTTGAAGAAGAAAME
jgi:hypothetical protein